VSQRMDDSLHGSFQTVLNPLRQGFLDFVGKIEAFGMCFSRWLHGLAELGCSVDQLSAVESLLSQTRDDEVSS